MIPSQPFNQHDFITAFDASVSKCEQLSRADARQFIEKGYVVVKNAFSTDIAHSVREQAWRELGEKHDIDEHHPGSWDKPLMGPDSMPGYVHTEGGRQSFSLKSDAPRAFFAQADVIGGCQRLPDRGDYLAWQDNALCNLGSLRGPSWQAPHPHQSDWHKDGWDFRHYLNSPEQGLIVVPLYSEIRPRSGGTFIATDSIAPLAHLLAAHQQGLHPDGLQNCGYLIPGIVEQCSRFEEITGEAGDMVILHPFTLHRVSPNPSLRSRFIGNAALVLAEPMQFDRTPGDTYSLIELAVLFALKRNTIYFEMTRPAETVVPEALRDEVQAIEQKKRLEQEMRMMAARGIVTPDWGTRHDYESNAEYGRAATDSLVPNSLTFSTTNRTSSSESPG